jgi:hypothetical protein
MNKLFVGLILFLFYLGALIMMSFQKEESVPVIGDWKYSFIIPVDTSYVSTTMTYYPTFDQCDSTPWSTADHSKIDPVKLRKKEIKWLALSRDLIWDEERQKLYKDTTHWRGPYPFGSVLYLKSSSKPWINGHWTVHDCKGPSYENSIDLLVDPRNNKPKLGICRDIMVIGYQLRKKLNL